MKLLAATRAALGPAPRRGRVAIDANDVGWFVDHGALVLGFTAVPGPNACIIHAMPGTLDVSLPELIDVANELPRYANAHTEALSRIAPMLAPGARFPRFPLPAVATHGRALALSSVALAGSALPRSWVGVQFVPLLVHADSPACAVLPAHLWSDDLRLAWLDFVACG